MFIVYLIQNNVTLERYIGTTKNLAKRLDEHNQGGKKFTTRKSGKWLLIYAEAYRSEHDSLLREKRLKHHASGKNELIKRLKNSLIA